MGCRNEGSREGDLCGPRYGVWTQEWAEGEESAGMVICCLHLECPAPGTLPGVLHGPRTQTQP